MRTILKMMMTRKRRAGSRLAKTGVADSRMRRREWLGRAFGALPLSSALSVLFSGPSSAGQKKKESKPVTDTLIKVTTFTEIGATLRGAEVELLPADKEGKPIKGKRLRGATNNMGEYPFYVPKNEATYVLRAEAKGFQITEKVVNAVGEDQIDVFLQLPAKK